MSVSIDNQLQPAFQNIIKSGIELIGLINKRGRLVSSMGPGRLDMPESKEEMFLMKIALRTTMQKDFDEDLGEVNYSMTQRGNRKFISIPASDHTIFAVTEKEFDHESLVKNIAQMLNNSDQFLGVALKEGATQVEHL